MVEGCNEITDEAGVMVTEVTLQSTRIGWTQYQYSKSGQASITGKYGYDAETGGSWTSF